jgi:hypothetical protein
MKILRRRKWGVLNRDTVHPELRAAAVCVWRRGLSHRFTIFFSRSRSLHRVRPTTGRNRGCGGRMKRARFQLRLLGRTSGPRQLRQPQRQRWDYGSVSEESVLQAGVEILLEVTNRSTNTISKGRL